MNQEPQKEKCPDYPTERHALNVEN